MKEVIAIKLNGAQILLEILKSEGVDQIFGYPGGMTIEIYDAMPGYSIPHLLMRHEQAAVHAADGYARISGKPGVCLVTSGPGATNTVTGIASAYMDSIPMVVITGQVPTCNIGNDAFQEVDIVGITRPCTKHNYMVTTVDKLAATVREAFHVARTGRPGPVLVDLPKDVTAEMINFKMPPAANPSNYRPTIRPHAGQIKKAVKLMLQSKRPIIFAGGGVILAKASERMARMAHMLQTPVTTSLMGLGGFPGSDPLFLGMPGMHGTYRANMAISDCDLIVAIGARFDDRVTGKIDEFAPKAKIIHIDIDPTSIRKNIPVTVPIVGDCDISLKMMLELLAEEDLSGIAELRKPWLEQVHEWKSSGKMAYEQKMDGAIKPQYVIEELRRITNGEAIITTEVGQNQMWTAQYYLFDKPNTFVTSGGLGCMGFGFPAAIGAQVAAPDRTVIDIAGDGSIQMNIQELATVVEHNLPVKIAILNNRYLGMVRQWQDLFKDKNYVATDMSGAPDFVKVAEAFGAVGLRATTPSEVEPVIREAMAIKRPVVMDFTVDREENVYPMVAAGDPIHKMMLA